MPLAQDVDHPCDDSRQSYCLHWHQPLLGIQDRTIRRYLRKGRLKGRKLARKWYVTEDSLQEYFEQPEEMELEEV
jgi:hypothetical protein